ncbi:MAG: hypothetical protein AB8G11_20220 [Saprospiraceae bacterium]
MNVTVERTEKEILIKLPLTTKISDIQQIMNYFEYINLVNKSQATQEQIDKLAKEVNQGWWKKNKERFIGKEGFEDFK